MTTHVLGVDPGLNGALALFANTSSVLIYDMPTLTITRGGKEKRELDFVALGDLIYNLSNGRVVKAYVEKVGAMPGQGVSSMFSFGKSYGGVLGILAALQIPVTDVPPQTWQKALKVNGGKDGSRHRASQLLPNIAGYWKLKKHDGRAEASLIAYYGHIHG